VLYSAPHEPGYFPNVCVGTIVSTGSTRAIVKFSWGCHFLRLDALTLADSETQQQSVDAPCNSVDAVLR